MSGLRHGQFVMVRTNLWKGRKQGVVESERPGVFCHSQGAAVAVQTTSGQLLVDPDRVRPATAEDLGGDR